AREAAAWPEHRGGVRVEAMAAVDESFREAVAHGEAFLGVLDRRREDAVETQAPAVLKQLAPRRDDTGDGRDERALSGEARAERVTRHRAWRGARAVVCGDLTRRRVVRQREEIAADRGAVRLRHRADGGRGDR